MKTEDAKTKIDNYLKRKLSDVGEIQRIPMRKIAVYCKIERSMRRKPKTLRKRAEKRIGARFKFFGSRCIHVPKENQWYVYHIIRKMAVPKK